MPGKKRNYRCVIYDCDGVLFDSLESNRKFYNHICYSLGRGAISDLELRFAHMRTVEEAVCHLFPDDPQSIRKALAMLPQIDPQEFIAYLTLEPNLLSAVHALKKKGIFRAINTNRSDSMKPLMDRFELWPFFDLVITAADVKNPKPHPESIEKILAKLNLKKKEAVFIGDSEVDRQAAESAGVKFIAYKNRSIAKESFIDDHLKILNFIEDGQIFE